MRAGMQADWGKWATIMQVVLLWRRKYKSLGRRCERDVRYARRWTNLGSLGTSTGPIGGTC